MRRPLHQDVRPSLPDKTCTQAARVSLAPTVATPAARSTGRHPQPTPSSRVSHPSSPAARVRRRSWRGDSSACRWRPECHPRQSSCRPLPHYWPARRGLTVRNRATRSSIQGRRTQLLWITMLPCSIASVASASSESPIWLSYMTSSVTASQILIRNASTSPPPFTSASVAVSMNP